MSKKFFVQKSAAIIGLIGALSMSLFNSCTQDNPTAPNKEVPSYTFSGSVLDGYTGKALGGAKVTYYDDKGDTVTTVTNLDGGFSITKIPYGDRSFFFSYRSTGTDTTKFTTAAVTLAGKLWENLGVSTDSIEIIIKNIAGAVKLYPLSGSISGNVLSQVNDRSELNAVAGTVVKVTFTPKDNNQQDSTSVNGSNVEVGPRTFEALTDATGRFSITGLPISGNADDKVTIKVVSVTAGGIDWEMKTVGGEPVEVELVKGQVVPVGQIVMKPIVLDTLKAIANNFKTGVVTPEQTFEISYSAALDTIASYAVLFSKDDGRNVVIATTVSGKKVTINPAYSLVNGSEYQIKTFAYGLKGSSAIDSFDITAAGGGLADVVSSNILTDTKSPVNNIGVKDAVTFTFTDSIVSKSAKVMVGAEQIDVTVSASNKTLTIAPKSLWKNNADATVTVVLSSGKTVNFSTKIFTENALGFVTSNVGDFNKMIGANPTPKNGLGLQDVIVFTTNKAIKNDDVKVIFKDSVSGTSLPVIVDVAEGDQQIEIQPVNALKAATKYTVIVTVENENGESNSATVTFTTTAALFFPIYDNVRIGNDSTMPRLDFTPNANIIIQMNNKVAKASAVLTEILGSPTAVNVKVAIQNDSIIIDPEKILSTTSTYDLTVKAEDSVGNTIDGKYKYVKGLKPQSLVYVKASNVITADGKPVVNAPRNVTPWFKLSSAPVAAQMKVTLSTGVDVAVTVNADTLFVNPVADFVYAQACTVFVKGVATDGNYIEFSKDFVVEKRPLLTIVKSNVLNDNYEGLTNVSENIEMWYKLSRTVTATSITAKVNDIDAVVRVSTSGDTIFVKSVKVLNAGSSPKVRIKGLDSEGLAIDLLGNNAADGLKAADWPSFTVRPALFPVASNTWGVKGKDDPVKNFPFYGTMWVKFSQPLSTDLTVIGWNGTGVPGVVVNPDVTTGNPNATAWVNVDTLFVKPDNRVAITYGNKVGFSVVVKTALNQQSADEVFVVESAPLDLFVKATNTLRADGTERNDFGFFDTLFVVSSLKIDSIDNVTSGTVAGHGDPPDIAAGLIKTAVRLSASKDTIFYVPKVAFVPGAKYTIDFNVFLSDDKNNLKSNVLGIGWEIKQGIAVFAANVFTSPTVYRKFAITGDSLVVTFTKAVNYSSTSNPFTVNGAPWGTSATKSWSADAKTVTIKPTTEITATTWANDQNYYNVAENHGSTITFTGIATDGEVFAGKGGQNRFIGAVNVVPEMGLALLSTNLLDSTNNVSFTLPVANTDDARDGVGTDSLLPIASNITLTFSRAIDTAKVKLNPNAYVQLWEDAATDIQNEITLTFSNAGKTITIDPVADMKYATTYYVAINGLPALITNATGVVYTNAHLFTNGFKTITKPTANISLLRVTDLAVDIAATTSTDKRYGYSPAGGYSIAGRYKGAGALTIKFTELAWNVNHPDSVGKYQVRVKAMGSHSTGWYTCDATFDSVPYSPFNDALKNRSALTINLNDVANAFRNDLKTPQKTGYTNADAVFNYGDSLAVEIRPIKDDGADPGEFGLWSNTIIFKDNVAPCDSIMCGLANYNNPALGGVSITVAGQSAIDNVWRGIRDTISSGSVNRAGSAPAFNALSSNSYYIMDLTFPEDMDVSATNVPVLSVVYGGASAPTGASALALNTAHSKWVSSRVYRLVYTIPATNFTTYDPYFVLNVATMKDASGVAIQASGNIGSGVTSAANTHGSSTVVADFGTQNIYQSGGNQIGMFW